MEAGGFKTREGQKGQMAERMERVSEPPERVEGESLKLVEVIEGVKNRMLGIERRTDEGRVT